MQFLKAFFIVFFISTSAISRAEILQDVVLGPDEMKTALELLNHQDLSEKTKDYVTWNNHNVTLTVKCAEKKCEFRQSIVETTNGDPEKFEEAHKKLPLSLNRSMIASVTLSEDQIKKVADTIEKMKNDIRDFRKDPENARWHDWGGGLQSRASIPDPLQFAKINGTLAGTISCYASEQGFSGRTVTAACKATAKVQP